MASKRWHQQFRDGDVMVEVTTCVATRPAVIHFKEILAAAEVVPDTDMSEAPWDNCDGLEHELRKPGDFEYADVEEMRGWCWDTGNRQRIVIVIADHWQRNRRGKIVDNTWGNYQWHRAHGASKQVAFEMVAQERKRLVDQLCQWYEHGWEWWGVKCEYEGREDSLWGIDSLEYAEDEVREECARNVARQLEEDGFTVVEMPVPSGHKYGWTKEQWQQEFARNLLTQSWKHNQIKRRHRRPAVASTR